MRGRYPTRVLRSAKNALVLFGCARNGENDGAWIADHGIPTVCVDILAERILPMQDAYPANWEFVQADAFEYVKTCDRFDVVSVDPPTELSAAVADHLIWWLSVAEKAVVLGMQTWTMSRLQEPPAGWEQTQVVRRSWSSVWVVYETE